MSKSIATNKKAYHDFEIIEKYEAGIVLEGSEVKALRAKKVNLKDSFCRFIKGELYLMNAHIGYLETTNRNFARDGRSPRKLLLHKRELDKLYGKTTKDGYSIIPLSLYFNSRNLAKVSIALAKGKKLHDKRETLKRKTQMREAQQAMKNYNR
ncbi:MAG: SsrA-binding protein SmpB [Epsilonproteobacteria bacterium]|nr:SsrA-binding protein SmpB [Campylobacterota bacterium]